jgi:hypothetical protein
MKLLFYQLIQEQMVIKAILKKSECQEKQGIRYDTEWLFQCLLLRVKSPKGYDHLRENGILPLPSHSTIQRLIRGIPGSFGLNDFSIDAIGRNLSGKEKYLRKGSLIWDEMSVKKALKFSKQKMKFDGLVDYGGDFLTNKRNKLADHALVLMFRCYRSKWVQPIAVYATSGAASSNVIQTIVVKALTALEKKGQLSTMLCVMVTRLIKEFIDS